MAFKSIFTVITDDKLAQRTLEHAAVIAAGFDAHLDAVCFGVDRTQTGYYYAGGRTRWCCKKR